MPDADVIARAATQLHGVELRTPRPCNIMSVAAVLIGYGGTMLLASAFGTDGAARDKLPTTTAMATLSLVTGALAMTSPTPSKKGEPGYITHMAAVHVGLLEPLVFAGVRVCSASPVKHRLTCVVFQACRPTGLTITGTQRVT